jgi:hypothetical protein
MKSTNLGRSGFPEEPLAQEQCLDVTYITQGSHHCEEKFPKKSINIKAGAQKNESCTDLVKKFRKLPVVSEYHTYCNVYGV